jgi:O-antigen/teichoic acid export membrane protein
VVTRNLRVSEGKKIGPRFNRKILRSLIRVALPMGGVAALLSLNLNIPRYFVEHYLGELALGLFAAAAYPMVVADTLIGSIAITSRLAQYYAANNRRRFNRYCSGSRVGNRVGFGAVLVSSWLVARY